MNEKEMDLMDMAADLRVFVERFKDIPPENNEEMYKSLREVCNYHIGNHPESFQEIKEIFLVVGHYIVRKQNELRYIKLLTEQYEKTEKEFFKDLEDGLWRKIGSEIPMEDYKSRYQIETEAEAKHFDSAGMVPYIIKRMQKAALTEQTEE